MNHPTEDQILLLAYGELPESDARDVEAHMGACSTCNATLAQLERGRVALDVALQDSKRSRRTWSLFAGLAAAAAVIAGVLITKGGPSRAPTERWTPTTTWSTTAGYVTGGKAMVDIDRQLTRLEQERYYGLPN